MRLQLLLLSTILFLFASPAFAQFPAVDLHGVPCIKLRVDEVIDKGSVKGDKPIKIKISVVKRMYAANNVPDHLVLTTPSYHTSDLIAPEGGPLKTPVIFPSPGTTAIVFLELENKNAATTIYWRADNEEQRDYTRMEIESLERNIPMDTIFEREYQKQLDKLDFAKMCAESTDVVVGTSKFTPKIFNSSASGIAVERFLKDSGNTTLKALPTASRTVYIAHANLSNHDSPMIVFLKAERSFTKITPQDLKRKFSFDSEKNTYDSLLFSYKPISTPYYAIMHSAAREAQIAKIIKEQKLTRTTLPPTNAGEIARIVEQSYDQNYRIKKEAGIKSSRYVNTSLAIQRFKELDASIKRNLGPHEMGVSAEHELVKLYSDIGKKAEYLAMKKRHEQLYDEVRKSIVDGGFLFGYFYAKPQTSIHSSDTQNKKIPIVKIPVH